MSRNLHEHPQDLRQDKIRATYLQYFSQIVLDWLKSQFVHKILFRICDIMDIYLVLLVHL